MRYVAGTCNLLPSSIIGVKDAWNCTFSLPSSLWLSVKHRNSFTLPADWCMLCQVVWTQWCSIELNFSLGLFHDATDSRLHSVGTSFFCLVWSSSSHLQGWSRLARSCVSIHKGCACSSSVCCATRVPLPGQFVSTILVADLAILTRIYQWLKSSCITIDGQSASLSWCQAPLSDPRPIFPSFLIYF
jgi:hypothetical protein